MTVGMALTPRSHWEAGGWGLVLTLCVCVCVCVTVSAHSVGLCEREGLADSVTCLVSQAGPLGTKPQA